MVDRITGQQSEAESARGNGGAAPQRSRKDGELTKLLRRAMQPDGADGHDQTRYSAPPPRCSPEALAAALPAWKRALDIALILITLPLWLPVMLIASAWVAITSPGPIFYRQPRVGFKCRRFMIVKFRTMKVNADTSTHEAYLEQLMASDKPMIKLDATGDPRLILGGKFLRATGLDELPQLFNVLRGEMSIVGPRPCTVREFELYSDEDRYRLNALPGLTGFWQVNGKNRTTFRQMIEMDVFYSKHLSLRLDLKIIARTFPAIAAQLVDLSQHLSARTAPPVSDNA
ncbi:MAG: sugar transferase [Verrucomicrobia bacterium]|nr:sugar transferase [Verrucomicrobiota bacterium]